MVDPAPHQPNLANHTLPTEQSIPTPALPETQDPRVEDDNSEPDIIQPTSPITSYPEPCRSTRTTAVRTRYGFIAGEGEDTNDNPTYEQAMASPAKARWQAAMDDKWNSFCHHNVGTLVEPPADANILGGMWVLS